MKPSFSKTPHGLRYITGESSHIKNSFDQEDLEIWLQRLSGEVPWRKMEWRAGKNLPRDVFRYDNLGSDQVPILESLVEFCEASFENRVQGVFCNRYVTGNDYTPPHQDNYGATTHVITYSFGGSRRFICENISTKEKTEYLLESGDVFYFSPTFDARHKHSIPKTAKAVDLRISIVMFCSEPYVKIVEVPKNIRTEKDNLAIQLDMFGGLMESGMVISLDQMAEILNTDSDTLCQQIIDIYGVKAMLVGSGHISGNKELNDKLKAKFPYLE